MRVLKTMENRALVKRVVSVGVEDFDMLKPAISWLNQHFPSWDQSSYWSYLQTPAARCYALLDSVEVVSLLLCSVVERESEILVFGTLEAQRRCGYGQALLQAAIDDLAHEAVSSIWLEVRASNLGAIRLYKRLGFEVFDCRRDYYRSPTEDGWIMKKSL